MSASITVMVAYALPHRQALREVVLRPGETAADAVRASGLLAEFPQIDLAVHRIAIHGRLSPLHAVLTDGDRVEVLRPLAADPKESRRARAAGRRLRR